MFPKKLAWYFLIMFLLSACSSNNGMPPPVVEASAAKAQTWQTEIEAIGSLSANQGVVVKPEIGGRITAVYFRSGDEVKANAPLIQINSDIVKAQLDAALAKITLSRANLIRIQTLLKKSVSSQSEFDTALASYKADEAAVNQFQATLNQTLVRSPFEGRLGLRLVNIGDYITAGQSITNIQDIDPLRVDFNIPEIYLSELKVGDTVLVKTDDYPNVVFQGTVYAFDSTVDPNTRSLAVRAIVPNKDQKLLPGEFVELKLLTGKPMQVVAIPEIALGNSADGSYVYKIVNNLAVKTKVTAGQHKDNQVVILDGLKPGDQVVSAGQFKLTTEQSPIIISK